MAIKKVLIFDPEVINEKDLLPRLQVAMDDRHITLTVVKEVNEFKHLLANQWQGIIVNFWTPYFWEVHFDEIIVLINDVRISQATAVFVALSPDEYQIRKISELGVTVRQKTIATKDLMASFGTSGKTGTITIESIQKLVCEHYDLPYPELLLKTRKREIVQGRQVTMYLAKAFTQCSLKTIGEHFGGRDHTTVIHSCQTVKDLMDTQPDFKSGVLFLMEKIRETA